MARTVTLVDTNTSTLSSRVTAELAEDGSLSIEGQDLGDAVEKVWGEGMIEYEWACSLAPEAVATLKSTLGCGDDLLAGLVERFSGERCGELTPFLTEHGIPYGFWSRFGD